MFYKLTGIGRIRAMPVLLLLLSVTQWVFATGVEIPLASNLAELAQASQQQGLPTIVFVSREACPFCRSLRDSILGPMYAANKFDQRANLVEVNLDQTDPITGFDNEPISAKAFGETYKAGITPTLLFLDARGREISKRRVGISNLELYGFYLDKSIDDALAVTRLR